MSIIFSSCTGYKLVKNDNPFSKYGIRTLSVPMFYNQSNLPNISSTFTSKFRNYFYEVKGIDVLGSRSKKKPDAYLIGIVRSPRKKTKTLNKLESLEGSSLSPGLVNKRNFLVPISSIINLSLDLYLLKTQGLKNFEVLKLREKKYPELLHKLNKSIVLEKNLKIFRTFERESFDGDNSQVNATQNLAIIEKVLNKESERILNEFKNKHIYVF